MVRMTSDGYWSEEYQVGPCDSADVEKVEVLRRLSGDLRLSEARCRLVYVFAVRRLKYCLFLEEDECRTVHQRHKPSAWTSVQRSPASGER